MENQINTSSLKRGELAAKINIDLFKMNQYSDQELLKIVKDYENANPRHLEPNDVEYWDAACLILIKRGL